MSEFTIWTVPGSPFARAAIAVLIEKGADWRLEPLAPGEQRSPAHLARQPFGKMPAFAHGAFQLYETQAILRYLDRILPEPRLSPTDLRALARMDQVMNVADNYLFKGVVNVIGLQRIVAPLLFGTSPDEAAIAAAMPDAHVVVDELARLLDEQTYFGGSELSLADFMVASQLDFLTTGPEWHPLTHGHDALLTWFDLMQGRASMRLSTMDKLRARALAD